MKVYTPLFSPVLDHSPAGNHAGPSEAAVDDNRGGVVFHRAGVSYQACSPVRSREGAKKAPSVTSVTALGQIGHTCNTLSGPHSRFRDELIEFIVESYTFVSAQCS